MHFRVVTFVIALGCCFELSVIRVIRVIRDTKDVDKNDVDEVISK